MRSNFNRSALVRQLAGWQAAPVDVPRQDLAERLGQWFNVADAIALSSLHQAMPAVARVRRPAVPASARSVQAELQRVRATLSQAITSPPLEPGDEGNEDTDAGFAPHLQRCLEQQRRMDMSIEALRGHVRKNLSLTSARLAQLAALDAVLEPMLGGREQRLLATVPNFLKTRFAELRQSHPGGWQPLFEHELQQTLLAELDLRLQPVAGMVEALSQEVKQHP
ncbi:hypothetical protein BSY239_728 [Hydrogenophaga sp. RAC07]|uniref:DUF3348 family protein n=1 Tax=Hydrogenophaga sp. RAC07 TaxID=1842537 RepID=UPI00083DFDB2|nr:DUF3348 family protein [Hydrogenophaga sp. RAC07]AOF84082.1 hypothetical protein BSY239_728 [Hydrogenophaga sp. RAC07]